MQLNSSQLNKDKTEIIVSGKKEEEWKLLVSSCQLGSAPAALQPFKR